MQRRRKNSNLKRDFSFIFVTWKLIYLNNKVKRKKGKKKSENLKNSKPINRISIDRAVVGLSFYLISLYRDLFGQSASL